MPIEIRELVIKATVGEDQGASSESSSGFDSELDINEIVNQCVSQVMEIIKQKRER